MTDAALSNLMKLQALEDLDLSSTMTSDRGLTHLTGLKSLRSLDLSYTG
jgi:Leucine-rich repeat (LRR) protein